MVPKIARIGAGQLGGTTQHRNFSDMRPFYGADNGRCWQVTHQQSGEHTLAPSTTAVTDWLVDRVGAPCGALASGHWGQEPSGALARRWDTDPVANIGCPPQPAQEAI